ncbi:HNH endonuclease [Candidatus Thiomargarita nelsonii]|uniref:HNH endonuclease n=1 Tax=Candidatus Thiomargarita nelsonii TaxID=1003181 RepID=A0A4E0QIM1_9GAMM|nr:HNH endonuclease [Candidatus Thiomargarita nelsonii]
MQRVFVLDHNKQQLMPCHPARARKLLKKGKAVVIRRYPFTIIMKHRVGGDLQPIEIKFDPGSRTTGIALVGHFDRGSEVIWAGNLNHRGLQIKSNLNSRRSIRSSRRNRKTRYRPARFLNRLRPKGWLPPSLRSRVDNVKNWMLKLSRLVPLTEITIETVRFDTQKLQKPEISGVEYQQGELAGYELREYLLEKWGRQCAYCGAKNVPLEIEHIQARSKGGTDRVSNLTLACTPCNQEKGNKDIKDFLKRKKKRLKKIQAQAKAPLKDAAAVNATRYATGNVLKGFSLPITFSSGGRTKFNRLKLGYKKDHWIDAACVGESGSHVVILKTITPLIITAKGRGSRQKCSMNQYGFPRTGPKKYKRVKGFQTGDIVKAVVTKGKKIGTYVGRVVVRATRSFDIGIGKEKVSGIGYKYCQLIQRSDGYEYT